MKHKMVSGRNRGAGSSASSRGARQLMIRQMNRISDVEVAAPAPELLLLPRKPAAALDDIRQDSNEASATIKHAIAYAEPAAFESAGEAVARVTAKSTTEAESESQAREGNISSSSSNSASQEGTTLGCHQDEQTARQLSSTAEPKSESQVRDSNSSNSNNSNTNNSSSSSSSSGASQEGITLGCLQDEHTARQLSSTAEPESESQSKSNNSNRNSSSSSSASQEGITLGCHQDEQAARHPSSPGAVNTENLFLTGHATTHSSSIPTDRATCKSPGHEVLCEEVGARGAESKPKRHSARRRSMVMSSTAAAAVPAVSEHASDRGTRHIPPFRWSSSTDAKDGDASDTSHCSTSISNINDSGGEELLPVPVSTATTNPGKHPLKRRRSSRRSSMRVGGGPGFSPLYTGECRETAAAAAAAALPAVSEHASERGTRQIPPFRWSSSTDAKEDDASDTSHCSTSINNINDSSGGEELLPVPVSTATMNLGKHPLKRRRSSRRSSMRVGGGPGFSPLYSDEFRETTALQRFDAPAPPATTAGVRNSSLNGANSSGAEGKEDLPSIQEERPRRRSRRTSSVGGSREAPPAGSAVGAAAVVGDACAEAFLPRPNVENSVEATSAATPPHEETPMRCSTQTRPSPVSARKLSLGAGAFRGVVDPTLLGVDVILDEVAATGGGGAGGDGGCSCGSQGEEEAAAREEFLPARRSIGEGRDSLAGGTPSAGRSSSLSGASSAGEALPTGRPSSSSRASSIGRASPAGRSPSASKARVSPEGSPVDAGKLHRSPAALMSPRIEGAIHTDQSCAGKRDTPPQKRRSRRRSLRCLPTGVFDGAGKMAPAAAALVRPSANASADGVKAAGCLGERGRTGVIADVVNESMHRLEATSTPPIEDGVSRMLRSLLAELVAAETCVVQHERKAAGAGTADMRRKAAAAAKRKKVRFCSFDFSTVDMPWDTADGSDLSATEVAKRLELVTEAKQRFQEALQELRDEGSGDRHGITLWKALLCELRSLSESAAAGPTALGVRRGCLVAGDEGRGRGVWRKKWHVADSVGAGAVAAETVARGDLSKAARFLLAELVPLEGVQVPAKSETRERLASTLSSLVRFKLRSLFNPPPEPLSVSGSAVLDGDASDRQKSFSKVHKVAELTLPTAKREISGKHAYDHTKDTALNAAVSRALRWMYGYSDEKALELIVEVEAFLTGIGGSNSKLAEEAAVDLAGQHAIAVADVAGAFHARLFLRSLLELEGVEAAIAQAGGWRDVEKLASALKGLKGCADMDQSLTLLSDVGELKSWLRAESLWRHGRRAEGIVQELLMLLVPLSENQKRRWMTAEAYERLLENVSDVQSRFAFPTVTKLPRAIVGETPALPSDAAEDRLGEFDHQHRMRAPTPKKAGRKPSPVARGKPVGGSSLKAGGRGTGQASAVAEEPLPKKRPVRSKRRASIM